MITFIINPSSGGGKALRTWQKLEPYLKKKGVNYEFFITKAKGEARDITAAICESSGEGREDRVVVAVGGDGTVNDMIEGLCTSKRLILGHIPAGTGNDLARGLGLPRCPKACLKKILAMDSIKNIDYGIVSFGKDGHKRFLVSSGIGFDAGIAQECLKLKKEELFGKGILRKLAYIRSGIKHLFESKTIKGFVLIDDIKKLEFNNIVFVSSHIHPYEGGGVRFAPKARNSDGELSICLVHQKNKFKLVRILLAAFWGNHLKYPGVRNYDCGEIRIHLERPAFVHVDGEICGEYQDVVLHCVSNKLRFIC